MASPCIDDPLDLKESIRQRRDQLHLSNPELAELSGLSLSTVANYFSIRSKSASAYTVGKLCAALNFSLDRAFGIVPSEEDLSDSARQIHALELLNSHQNSEICRLRDVADLHRSYAASRRLSHIVLICLCVLQSITLSVYLFADASDHEHGFFLGGQPTPPAYFILAVVVSSAVVIAWAAVRYFARAGRYFAIAKKRGGAA